MYKYGSSSSTHRSISKKPPPLLNRLAIDTDSTPAPEVFQLDESPLENRRGIDTKTLLILSGISPFWGGGGNEGGRTPGGGGG